MLAVIRQKDKNQSQKKPFDTHQTAKNWKKLKF
jgi:hypothetical protein